MSLLRRLQEEVADQHATPGVAVTHDASVVDVDPIAVACVHLERARIEVVDPEPAAIPTELISGVRSARGVDLDLVSSGSRHTIDLRHAANVNRARYSHRAAVVDQVCFDWHDSA